MYKYTGTTETDQLSLDSDNTEAKVDAVMVPCIGTTPTFPVSLLSAKETLLGDIYRWTKVWCV
jgi:hypothetical protein